MQGLKNNIANILTLSNAVIGLISVFLTISGNYTWAALMIFVAIIFDILDGEVARKLKITSDLGAELDSLSDIISFGIASSILLYVSLFNQSTIGAFVAILIVICGVYRLARFNVVKKQKTFTGLPIPAMAAIVSSFVLTENVFSTMQITSIFVIVALLMVSKIPYPIINNLDSKNIRLFVVLGLIFALVLFLINPLYFIMAPFMYYAILGMFSIKK
ncbi:CDP-diacylglycerol--serine O-phosphatidyltransferase [archaeon]|nr:CDP-diacylglycerol--serine O-phosphatidyltransferase [archaeon]